MQLTISFQRITGKFAVSLLHLDHNHAVSREQFQLYPDQRRPAGNVAEEVDSMLSVNGHPTLVAQVLHSQGLPVRVKDLHNRKQKLTKSGLTLNERVQATLSATHHRIAHSEDNKFEALYMQTAEQRKIFAKYGEVLQLDAAYKTNNMRYPLFTLLVEDGDGLGQPVAFAIMAREDQSHVEGFLKYFGEANDMSRTHCVVVDKDMAEINAVKKCWNFPVLICYFHVLRAIDRHLASTNMSAEEKELSCLYAKQLLNAQTNEQFDAAVQLIKDELPCFYSYIEVNWLPYKDSISSVGRKSLRHLSNRTNNRIESFHDTLKKLIPSSRVDLDILIKHLISMLNVRSVEAAHRHFDATMKTTLVSNNTPAVHQYYQLCTRYCASLICNEIDKAQTKKYVVTISVDTGNQTVTNETTRAVYHVDSNFQCSCNHTCTMGFPCRHVFAVWLFNGSQLYRLETVADRWLIGAVEPLLQPAPNDSLQAMSVEPSVSRGSRFNAAMVLMREIASFIADQPASTFANYSSTLETLREKLFEGRVTDVLTCLKKLDEDTQHGPAILPELIGDGDRLQSSHRVRDNDGDIQSQSTDTASFDANEFDTAVLPQPVSDGAHSQSSNPVLDNDDDAAVQALVSLLQENENSEVPSANVIHFAPVPKARGRPAASRQSAFKVFGRKRQAAKPLSSPPSKAARVQDGENSSVNNCVQCGMLDPPALKQGRRRNIVWLQCDACDFWYHLCCTDRQRKPRTNERFECVLCTADRT